MPHIKHYIFNIAGFNISVPKFICQTMKANRAFEKGLLDVIGNCLQPTIKHIVAAERQPNHKEIQISTANLMALFNAMSKTEFKKFILDFNADVGGENLKDLVSSILTAFNCMIFNNYCSNFQLL